MTYYVAKKLDFEALVRIIEKLEEHTDDGKTLYIISLFTGEIFAYRNYLGLWEINI